MSRLTLSFSLLSVIVSCAVRAATPEVAVVVQADESFSPQAWQAMTAETKRIAGQAGIRLQFLNRSEAAEKEFNDLVMFRMRGKCEMDDTPQLLDERGPFAWAFSADGNVLPFGEVKCERVKQSVKSAMAPKDRRRADELLGRALGRVVAHEIYHMLVNTKSHGKSGVARDALSGRQLIAETLDFGEHERHALEVKQEVR